MKIFGEPWDSPVCDGAEQVETPVGGVCLLCKELVDEGDRGVLMPYGSTNGSEERPEHAECFLRSMLGAPEHILGLCSCHGGGEDVWTESYREQARVTWRLMMGPERG